MKAFKQTKRLVFVAFALVLSMALTITSTYAWFTASTSATVNGLEFNALSESSSLLVSLDQSEGWKSVTGYSASVTYSADENPALATKLAMKLGAYTSVNGKSFTGDPAGEPEGHVVSFSIRFRSDTRVGVALSLSSEIIAGESFAGMKPVYAWANSDDGAPEPTPQFDPTAYGLTHEGEAIATNMTEGAPIKLSSAYAARLSFDNGTGDAPIWNPQKDNRITDSKLAEDDYYVIPDSMTNNFAHDYKNQLLSTETPLPSDGTETVLRDGNLTLNTQKLLTLEAPTGGSADLQNFYFGSLTVNVWLEGWDSSCTNAILNDIFKANLVFITVAAD